MPTKPTKKAVEASRQVPDAHDIVSAVVGDDATLKNSFAQAGLLNDVERDGDGNITNFSLTDDIHAIGKTVMSYDPHYNPFLNALVNRIAFVIIKNRTYDNPWAVFKKGFMELGETVEEIFVDICDPHRFSPIKAEQQLYKREIPDVKAAFHTMNWQVFYKQTISNDQLRTAFLSWQGVSDLVAKIVTAMSTSMNLDEMYMMKYLIAKAILNGDLHVVNVPELNAENAKSVLSAIQKVTLDLKWPSRDYNIAGVMNHTPVSEQRFIETNASIATLNVEALATLFNLDKADYMQQRIDVDSFSNLDWGRLQIMFTDPDTGEVDPNYKKFTEDQIKLLDSVVGAIVDVDWWMVYDNFQNMTQNYNGEGLYWNYWLHGWKTFSYSPFSNAIVLTSTAQSITSVEVTPSTATVSKGQQVVLTPTVKGTGIVNTNVLWSVKGSSALASGTHISSDGKLYVAIDETNATLTVTCTSQQDSGKTGTATITVSGNGE